MHFIELPKLAKQYRLENELDRWLMLLHVVNKDGVDSDLLEKLLQIDGGDKVMKRAIEEWEALSKDEITVAEYKARRKAILDQNSMIDGAIWNDRLKAIKDLIDDGVSERSIMKAYDLSIEELNKIKDSYK